MTVEVPDALLRRAMRVARLESREQVVPLALEEFSTPRGQASLIQYLGKLDGFMTREELLESRSSE